MANEANGSGKLQTAPEAPAPSISVWARIQGTQSCAVDPRLVAAAYAALDGLRLMSETFEWPNQLVRFSQSF